MYWMCSCVSSAGCVRAGQSGSGERGQQRAMIDRPPGRVGLLPQPNHNQTHPRHQPRRHGPPGAVPRRVRALAPPSSFIPTMSNPVRSPLPITPTLTVLIQTSAESHNKTHRKSSMRSARAWTSVLDTMFDAAVDGRAVACLWWVGLCFYVPSAARGGVAGHRSVISIGGGQRRALMDGLIERVRRGGSTDHLVSDAVPRAKGQHRATASPPLAFAFASVDVRDRSRSLLPRQRER